jgi:xanthine dehydrogenase small subunit
MGVRFVLNGRAVSAADADSHVTVLQWLREQGLCGTKEGCAEGECGACAVALVQSEPGESGSHFEAVNSCLFPLAALEGRELVTIEGVALADGSLHPVQAAMVAAGGSQCGYCTPGFVVSLFCEYYRPGRARFDPESISGNLCRCTGYRPIADVGRALAAPASDDPRLVQLRARAPALAASESGSVEERFFRPTTLGDAFDLLEVHAGALPIAGGTDLMVYENQRYQRFPALVSLEALSELHELSFTETEIVLGAAVPLRRIEHALHGTFAEQRSDVSLAGRAAPARAALLEQLFPLFSSQLIRNRATLGGNLGTASPIGDSAPALLALGACVELVSRQGLRRLPLSEFFVGYRRTVLEPGELIRALRIAQPLPTFQRFYKVSKRVLDDISTVAGAFALSLDRAGNVLRLGVGFGGVAAVPIAAPSLERAALGRAWNPATLALLLSEVRELGTPQTDLRGSSAYRRAMMSKLLEQFFYDSRSFVGAAE